MTSWVRYDKLLFHERQTVTGRNVQVLKFLMFLIVLLVHLVTLFSRSLDLLSTMWLKASVKFYTRRKLQLNYFCVVYFSRHVDIQYISTFGLFLFIYFYFLLWV